MIFVRPTAGLGNRMSVINSCMILARNNGNASIKMFWEKTPELNAAFEELFKPINGIKLIHSPKIFNYFSFYRKGKCKHSLESKLKSHIFNLFARSYKYYDNEDVIPLAFHEDHWNKGHSKVVVETYCDLYKKIPSNNNYFLFRPSDNLKKEIDKLTETFNEKTIGVHIRRTDNEKAIKNSPDHLFIRRMENLLRDDNSTNFFLCTDEPETEKNFKSYFGDRILSVEDKILDRNKQDGIKHAVIDMFCLSKTKIILGSYWSSFSLVAANINKTPLEIIRF